MRLIQQKVRGRMVVDDGFLLWTKASAKVSAEEVDVSADAYSFIRYAFAMRGTEHAVYPALLLDDWGNEVRKLELYAWVEEHGDAFPRAEIFGRDHAGKETQVFLRELELVYRYGAVIAPARDALIADCVPLRHIFLSDPAVSAPERCKPPEKVTTPLRRARIKWWKLPPEYQSVDGGDFAFRSISDQ